MRREMIGGLAGLAVCASTAVALGGCGGSQTKTVSVASAPEGAQSRPASTTPASTQTTTTTTTSTTETPAPASTAGGTAAPPSTHTAPEPAFTQQEGQAEGLKAAQDVLQARGYTANETSQYHPNQTLRVLVGTRTGSGSGDGNGQQAFFFVDGRYLGTDTKEPSATIRVISQSDTEVTLAYALYRPGDPLSSPSGGQATVRFALNDGKLTALGQIPPANSPNGPSRY
jgi:LppP/LprE lipoprotein